MVSLRPALVFAHGLLFIVGFFFRSLLALRKAIRREGGGHISVTVCVCAQVGSIHIFMGVYV